MLGKIDTKTATAIDAQLKKIFKIYGISFSIDCLFVILLLVSRTYGK